MRWRVRRGGCCRRSSRDGGGGSREKLGTGRASYGKVDVVHVPGYWFRWMTDVLESAGRGLMAAMWASCSLRERDVAKRVSNPLALRPAAVQPPADWSEPAES